MKDKKFQEIRKKSIESIISWYLDPFPVEIRNKIKENTQAMQLIRDYAVEHFDKTYKLVNSLEDVLKIQLKNIVLR